MRHYLALLVTFLVMINIALGAVGDADVSNTASDYQPEQSYATGTDTWNAGSQPSGLQGGYIDSYMPHEGSLSNSGQGNYPLPVQKPSSSQGSAYPAPQISGPVAEQLTAEELGLSLPQMESFTPDGSLGFVSAALPDRANQAIYAPVQSAGQAGQSSTQPSVQAALPGSNTWYYPSSVVSANRFYVQTASGLRTVGGCGYRGYLPLWADIKSSGHFFVYEWYPGQSSPSVRWWGWTGTGWKKGWFSGDVPGWHILCYNSGIWSNYVYIYVYPAAAVSSASSGYSNAVPSMTAVALPSGAPVPPDPGAEGLVMPDFNLYRPGNSALKSSSPTSPAQVNPALANPALANPSLVSYPDQFAHGAAGMAGSPTSTATTCTSSTVIAGGVSCSDPCGKSCPTCAMQASPSAPIGYAMQSYKAVYPVPSVCRCNEYYVQTCPGGLETVAGVFCGEWLPLWSKVSRPGEYWSFEWTVCAGGPGNYCSPEVKNFGYKSSGWYQTYFKGNNPGWHILSYHCNDWSNYVYIYVWPED